MIADAVSHSRLRSHWDRKLLVQMLGCSLFLHSSLLAVATVKWGLNFGKPRFAPVYSVELVSLPESTDTKEQTFNAAPKARPVVSRSAIPIQRFKAKKQRLILRKKQRTVISEMEPEETELTEKTLTKTKRRPEPRLPLAAKGRKARGQARSGRKKVALVNIGGMSGDELSQALGLYRALVNEKIESNWVFPEHLNREGAELEAIVVVHARRDGTLFGIDFEKKSGDPYFDDSVMKAILKSKPFPPFPDIYSPKEEEIVIRFSPPNGRS
jgi:colicin import membrane protein